MKERKITKAVIPAAGIGTRMLPASKAQPKEMFVVVDKPVIQHVVEEAARSGCKEIAIIISEGKESIKAHFSKQTWLEDLLKAKNRERDLEALEHLNNLGKIEFIYQKEPAGLGDAVRCAEEFVGNDAFALLLGDTIIDSPKPVTLSLIEIALEHHGAAVALQTVDRALISRYGAFDGPEISPNLYRAVRVEEKPNPQRWGESNLVFSGRYVFNSDIFSMLEKTGRGINHEYQLTDAMRLMTAEYLSAEALQRNGNEPSATPLFGYRFEGKRFDVGNTLELIKTNLLLGLKSEHYGPELQKWMSETFLVQFPSLWL